MTRSSDVGDNDKLECKVHVSGIPIDVSEEDLNKRLEKVEGFNLEMKHQEGNRKKYAFVYCKNKAVASQVIQQLNYVDAKGNKIKAVPSEKAEEGVDPKILKTVEYTIGNKEGHIKFITELRQKLSKLKEGTNVVDDILEGDCAHPLLVAKPSGKKAAQWIHVVLRATDEQEKEVMQTTLAVRKDNLYVKGFMNKAEQWFELPSNAANDNMKLPENYKARELKGWDVSYRGLMNLSNKNQVKKTLMSTRLCKAFAVRAVRRLWGYRIWDENDENSEEKIDENLTRLALAGLMVMICEAARMNPFLDTIAGGWDRGTGLTSRLLDIMWDWGSMSAALLKWKKSGKWPIKCRHGLGTALASINLVLDSTDVTGSGPTWVEIFAVSSNCPVISVTVIDEGKCKNTIYKQETEQVQTQQGIVEPLKLTVKGRRISGYEYFGMEFVLPPSTGSGDSITKKFKWDDCRKQDGDATQLVARTIAFDHESKIVVTYLVMNNVEEAKVEVKLRLIGGREESTEYYSANQRRIVPRGTKKIGGKKYTARGEIVAQIDGFEDHQIVLFRTEGEEEFTLDLETSILMRSSVSVPFGKRLHIDMEALHIKEAPGDRPVKKPSRLSYDFRSWKPTPCHVGDQVDENIEVEVNVAWPAQDETVERKPDVVFIIGDGDKFTSSIMELRDVLAYHPHREDALEGYIDEKLPDTGKHPVLAREHRFGQPPRWIHVKLQVGAGKEAPSMTLALRDDQCYGAGFMNQNGVWYDIGSYRWLRRGDKQLPPEYNSVRLDWDNHLWSDVAQYELISQRLGGIRLGKKSAMAAVETLSRYPDVKEGEKPILALTVLIIMVCESARFNPILKSIATDWDADTGMELTNDMYEYTRSWHHISFSLLCWKDSGHNNNLKWPPKYSKMGINCTDVCLVFNSDERPKQIYMDCNIEVKEEFIQFIKDLRVVLADHEHREGILDGHPNPKSVSNLNNSALLYRDPERVIHIKLQLAKEEMSTTLAVRDNDVQPVGFMNHEGVWYGAWNPYEGKGMPPEAGLTAEFDPEPLMWGSYKDMLPHLDLSKHMLHYLCLSKDEQDVDVSPPKKDVDLSAWDKVREKLGAEGLGKDFAVKAVRTLSRYPDVEEGDCPRLALAGLTIMVCESARLNPVYKHVEDVWDKKGTGFPNELMKLVQGSDLISDTLRIWWKGGYSCWPGRSVDRIHRDGLRGMGIHSPQDALNSVHLVSTRMMDWYWDDESFP